MNETTLILMVLLGLIVVPVGCAMFTRWLSGSDTLAVFIGTSALPFLFFANFVYWLETMDVDDAPPGNVLGGTLIAMAISGALSFLISLFVVRLLRKSA